MTDQSVLTVYYDGSCPLCRREIGYYMRREGADRITWVDLATAPDNALPIDKSRAELMARFHVKDAEGRTQSGVAAFIEVWHTLPAFRPFTVVKRIPGLVKLLDHAYCYFLRIRGALKRTCHEKNNLHISGRRVG